MPSAQQQEIAAPQPPALPQEVAIVNPGVPQSRADVLALRAQRSELSNQLQSAARRRSEIAEALDKARPAERPGLEARLQQLDARILNIEAEIERTGQLIAQAPGQYLRSSSPADNPVGGRLPVNMTAISVIFTLFVLMPIAVAFARSLWKRASNPPPPAIDRETAERLKRLEAGVDAIAIEVERISESQRFVTKLMADRERQRIEAGER